MEKRFPHKDMLSSCRRPPKDSKPQLICLNHRIAVSHFSNSNDLEVASDLTADETRVG